MKLDHLAFLVIPMIFIFLFVSPSSAQTYLPDPYTPVTDGDGHIVYVDPGETIPYIVSSTHDDFVSYSADLLYQMDYDGFPDQIKIFDPPFKKSDYLYSGRRLES